MKKLKDYMNILANKFYREKLKAQKFFELRTEVLLTIGSRKRYQDLAKGDQNQFNKEETIVTQKFQSGSCLRKIIQNLSKYREEIFILSQNTTTLENSIYNASFYPEASRNWKKWLLKRFNMVERIKV